MQQHPRCFGRSRRSEWLVQLPAIANSAVSARCISGIRFGRRFARIMVFAVSALVSVAASADTRAISLDLLKPTPEHRQATAGIVQLMQRYHYKRVEIGDELSEQIFDRYLETLDPQKNFFLASDVAEFDRYRRKFDDALRNARLNPVFDVFKRFRSRVEDRAAFARNLLKREFDFTIDESYTFNREDAQWAGSQSEMDELWRKRVKNDVLNLRLAEQVDDDLVETLEDRYERMERRVSQLAANDVFQFFINSYTCLLYTSPSPRDS